MAGEKILDWGLGDNDSGVLVRLFKENKSLIIKIKADGVWWEAEMDMEISKDRIIINDKLNNKVIEIPAPWSKA